MSTLELQKNLGLSLAEQTIVAARLKHEARTRAIRGLAWLLLGIVVTALTYLTAKPGSTYAVAWGSIIFGGFRFIVNAYHYLYTYPLLRDALGDKAAERFRSRAAAEHAAFVVASISSSLVIALFAGIFIAGNLLPVSVASSDVPVLITTDDKSWQTADTIAGNINQYVASNRSIPASLKDAGFKATLPRSISYQKASDDAYKFCVTYQANGTAQTADGRVLDGPLVSRSQLIVPAKHGAGPNCQMIVPLFGNSSTKVDRPADLSAEAALGCSVAGVTDTAHQSGTITKTSTGVMQQGIAEYILAIPSRGGGLIFKVQAEAHVFDNNCKTLDHSAVFSGDTVDIFDDVRYPVTVTGDPATALVIIDRSK